MVEEEKAGGKGKGKVEEGKWEGGDTQELEGIVKAEGKRGGEELRWMEARGKQEEGTEGEEGELEDIIKAVSVMDNTAFDLTVVRGGVLRLGVGAVCEVILKYTVSTLDHSSPVIYSHYSFTFCDSQFGSFHPQI